MVKSCAGTTSDEQQDRTSEYGGVELFRGLGQNEIRFMLSAGTRRRFKASDFVMRIDQSAKHLFLVLTGGIDFYVLTRDGAKLLLRRMMPGDIFGVASFLAEPHGYM